MAGIIATLNVDGHEWPNGYIDLPYCRTDLTITEPGFEQGKCFVSHRYYLSRESYLNDPNKFFSMNDDPIPRAIELPYVPASDPIQSALVVLQEWFPDCEVFQ